MSGKNEAARKIAVPQSPATIPPQAAQAVKNLEALAQNGPALEALRKLFGGAAGTPAPASLGPDSALYVALAQSMQATTAAAERAHREVDRLREENAKLREDAEAFRRVKEAEALERSASAKSAAIVNSVLDQALVIANEKGGNEALADLMIALAQKTGLELTPNHIDALSGKTTAAKEE